MLRLWAVILLLSILIQAFSRQVIFTEFLLNRDFIAKVLCVKKDEKVNQCLGKCHLKKQLQQDNERQTKNHQQNKTVIEVLFSEDNETIVFKNYPSEFYLSDFNFTDQVLKGYTSAIFHPPSC